MLKLQPPHIAYKYLLDKGENLTASEIVYLHNKEVSIKKITNATGLRREAVRLILNYADKYIENHKKVVMEMGKFNLTQAEYNGHKELGRSDDEIAKIAEVSPGTLGYHKKKWLKEEVKPRTPKLILAEGEKVATVHEDLVHDLSKKLRKAEFELDVREKFNSQLEKKIGELEEQIKNLHAAAEDTEKEVAASQEHVQREQELMEDASYWKLQAQQYQAENKRLNDTLDEIRQEKEKHKGDSLAFRLALKAVL